MPMLSSNMECIEIKWLHDKYANFVKGKVYTAQARAIRGDNAYTNFTITDEDGDHFVLDFDRIDKDFIIVGGGQ